jgi:hypothetical protein
MLLNRFVHEARRVPAPTCRDSGSGFRVPGLGLGFRVWSRTKMRTCIRLRRRQQRPRRRWHSRCQHPGMLAGLRDETHDMRHDPHATSCQCSDIFNVQGQGSGFKGQNTCCFCDHKRQHRGVIHTLSRCIIYTHTRYIANTLTLHHTHSHATCRCHDNKRVARRQSPPSLEFGIQCLGLTEVTATQPT